MMVVVQKGSGMRSLWIYEQGRACAAAQGAEQLVYGFDDREYANATLPHRVPAETRNLTVGFSSHVLNYRVARAIMHCRPHYLYILDLHGCTLDIPRIAKLMGVRVCLEVTEMPDIAALSKSPVAHVLNDLRSVDYLIFDEQGLPSSGWFEGLPPLTRFEALARVQADKLAVWQTAPDYARYEFCLRDPPLLRQMQSPYVDYFQECRNVLDVGCGAGIFLELLKDAGIEAVGVERDPDISAYARGMGFEVVCADALAYLKKNTRAFEGIYCSHLVEHLHFPQVKELIEHMAGALTDNGILVLVFPDPESIRSQLLGFWRDPEHVRFYHPELIELLASACGLSCEWSSSRELHDPVGEFSATPPAIEISQPDCMELAAIEVGPPTWWERLLRKVGLASSAKFILMEREFDRLKERMRRLDEAIVHQVDSLQALDRKANALWQVNATWAWDDNAVLKFRKRI